MKVKRYEWEDALVLAQREGHISNGALLVAIKLARAINWEPKDGRKPGLYWKNDEALANVGAARASYFRHKQSLVETGFFKEEAGNLIPSLPESLGETTQQSLGETKESLPETTESLGETEKSLGDNPFTVDILSEDVLPVEHVVEEPLQETKDRQTDDSLFVGIKEDAQIIKHDAEPSFVENKTKHFFVKVVGGPELSSKTITEAVAKYRSDREAMDIWSEAAEQSYPLALEKALDPNWKPGLFDLDRRVDRAFIEASHERRREPEVVPVAVGDDW